MDGQFIRVLRKHENVELLLNVNSIWKIEVSYARRISPNQIQDIGLAEGQNDPDALRVYTVYVGVERVVLASAPGDPVMKVLEDIYKGAIRTEEP